LLQVRELGGTRVGASATKASLDAGRESLGLPAIDVADAPVADGY
jgi:hypothetical protein